MMIKSLSLSNFRRFEVLDIDFHDELTVIVARNGQGKSTILDAATIALGTFVGAFDLGKGKHIDNSDARYQRLSNSMESEQHYPVIVEARFSQPQMAVGRTLTGPKNKTTIKEAAEITDYGKQLMQKVRDLEEVTLPVVAYYGSGRLWNAHKNMTRKAVLSASRSMGYEDCLSSASSFKQVQQWISKATYAVLQQQEMPEYDKYNLPEQLEGIKTAVNQVLADEGWRNFHYSLSHEELTMFHEDHGTLSVSLLSDGVRAMVSLTADLAWRCTKLNPHLGEDAPTTTQGIVFIDEVDMHLHPVWQQKVIKSLQNTFPKMQLIVTTHSPQVLTTVDKENIRLLRKQWDEDDQSWKLEVITPKLQTKGVASYEVLAHIMGIDPVPDVPEARQLAKYQNFIEQENYDSEEANRLRKELISHFGEIHPVILECDRLIRLQEMKKKIQEKRSNDA